MDLLWGEEPEFFDVPRFKSLIEEGIMDTVEFFVKSVDNGKCYCAVN